jgi:signal transduction histidine kinase
MNNYLVPIHILMATSALAMMFVLKNATAPKDRNTSYYIFIIGLMVSFIGYAVRGTIFAFDFFIIDNETDRTQVGGNIAVVLINVVLGIAIFLKVLLIRSLLGKDVVWWHALMQFLLVLGVSLAPAPFLSEDGESLALYSPATIFYLICASLIVFTLHKVRNQSGLLLGRWVYLLALATVYVNIVGLVVLWVSLSDIDARGFDFIDPFDSWVRGIRVSLFFCIDIGLLYFWLQHYSTEALRAIEDRARLGALLAEKEILVCNLLDADALVHSGALAAGLSHELNQILTRIQLDAEWAKSYVLANQSPDRIVSILNRVTNANQEAAKLILSLKKLFVKRMDEGTLCELDSMVESVVALYASRIKQSGIEFECRAHTGTRAILDDGLIRRVISNLLANALDACNAASRKDLKVIVTSQVEGGAWYVSVSDNAMGVHPSVMHKVFGLFATTKSDGTGVGLWLSQHIIEIHAGSIRFENLDAGGVKFSFRIPLRDASNQPNSLPNLSVST